MTREKLYEIAVYALSDMKISVKLIEKLQRPMTNPNWEAESMLLARQLKRTHEAVRAMEKAVLEKEP